VARQQVNACWLLMASNVFFASCWVDLLFE